MPSTHFSIAGINVELASIKTSDFPRYTTCHNNLYKSLVPFISTASPNCDLRIRCTELDEFAEKQLLLTESRYLSWYKLYDGGYRLIIHYSDDKSKHTILDVDDNFKNAIIKRSCCTRLSCGEGECLFAGPHGEILVRYSAILHGAIQIHSSAIGYGGKSIIFSAPSGTGKTTHAHFWVEHFNAFMLNGDRPIIRMHEDNAVFAYGSPWSGSDRFFVNKKLPLHAIVFIEQAASNKVFKLEAHEAVDRILPRCYLPYFSPMMMVEALLNVENILKHVPCYLLQCTPERSSADLLKDYLGL